jgi:hypothetical protein
MLRGLQLAVFSTRQCWMLVALRMAHRRALRVGHHLLRRSCSKPTLRTRIFGTASPKRFTHILAPNPSSLLACNGSPEQSCPGIPNRYCHSLFRHASVCRDAQPGSPAAHPCNSRDTRDTNRATGRSRKQVKEAKSFTAQDKEKASDQVEDKA